MGVLPFEVEATAGCATGGAMAGNGGSWSVEERSAVSLGNVAADNLAHLVFLTHRFEVFTREQCADLSAERSRLPVSASDLAEPRRALDYLFFGKVKGLSVRRHRAMAEGRVSREDRWTWGDPQTEVTVDCTVEIRLVESDTGRVAAGGSGRLQRTETLAALGIDIFGVSATDPEALEVSDDDKGKIVRLTLDETLRRMLPAIDSYLVENAGEAGALGPASAPAPSGSPPSTTPPRFCQQCGSRCALGAAFCTSCGAEVER